MEENFIIWFIVFGGYLIILVIAIPAIFELGFTHKT